MPWVPLTVRGPSDAVVGRRDVDENGLMEEEPLPEAANGFGLVVVAASAGGVQALMKLVAALPADFALPVVIVQHVDPRHRSLLVEILSRRARLRVRHAEEGTILTVGDIFIAPPGSHVLVNPDRSLSLSKAELVHFVRPSADLLFESAAASFGDGVIAVVLTGSGEDGASGVRAVKKMGGTVVAQDRESSEFFGMPGAAIATGDVDFVLPLDEIPAALVTLSTIPDRP
jgi:two-component system, chemotaxis family, protein-glutamate methylesterase/glutaminase